jgi:methylenetetrahydrofolate--tRNA-(uracil-5-)-methyltransferase
VESIATGLLAGVLACRMVAGEPVEAPPGETAVGALCHYVSHADPRRYQPANIAFDLFPPLENPIHDRAERHAVICRRAQAAMEHYLDASVTA